VNPKLSILDLAPINRGQTATESFAASVELAQAAERLGYERVWYAEHHNMTTIASSATSVLIAHIGAQTNTIRLGSGGIMLPNHAPLVIAEQFGTLEAMYPGRIDLGLGRAPGSDQATTYALRRSPQSAESFPQDVLELQAFLTGNSRIEGVDATPGKGANVPLYILGSSMFGAKLAAALGLPYAFASHFAPDLLLPAIEAYRAEFTPSEQLEAPYVIAGANVIGAETLEQAQHYLLEVRRIRAVSLFGRRVGASALEVSDARADQLLASGAAQHVDQMMTYTGVGTTTEVRAFIDEFAETTKADEIIVAHNVPSAEGRVRSAEILAEAMQLQPAAA
jgi:luciferase family oxidoreductase group 1